MYVSGLPEGTDDARVKEIFQPYGEVSWCRALPREGSKTCGLIEFSTAEQAAWVVSNMQGSVPAGLEDPIMVKYKDDPWERKGKGKGGGFYPDGMGMGGWQDDGWGGGGWDNGWDDEAGRGPGLAGAGITVPPMAAIAAAAANAGKGGGGKEPYVVVPPKGGVKGNLLPYELQPPSEPMPADNLYLRNLPADLTEERLREIFGTFGNITQTKLMTGLGKQSALVRYSTVAEAIAALTSLKDMVPIGLTELVEAKFAESTQRQNQRYAGDGTPFGIDTIVKGFQMSGLMPGGTGYTSNNDNALYIAGLPPDTTDYYLYRLFSPLGAIAPKGVRTLTNEDGTCKGIAFVNYLEHHSAQMAISIYNGTIMPDGSRLKVAIKAPKVHTGPMPVVVPAPVRMPDGFPGLSVAPPVPANVTPAVLPMTIPPPNVSVPGGGDGGGHMAMDMGSGPAAMDMGGGPVAMDMGDSISPGISAMAAAAAAAAAADAATAKAA